MNVHSSPKPTRTVSVVIETSVRHQSLAFHTPPIFRQDIAFNWVFTIDGLITKVHQLVKSISLIRQFSDDAAAAAGTVACGQTVAELSFPIRGVATEKAVQTEALPCE